MSICPKNKTSKARRDKRRANWKMSAPNLVKCSKCGRAYDATQSLQGMVPGLLVSNSNTGRPGASGTLTLRGQGNLE